MNLFQRQREGKGQDAFIKGATFSALFLVFPAFFLELSSFLQFFLPGIAASFLAGFELGSSLIFLFAVFVLAGILGATFGFAFVPMILSQGIVIAGILLISKERKISAPKALLTTFLGLTIMELAMVVGLTGGEIAAIYDQTLNAMLSEFDKGIKLYMENSSENISPQLNQVIAAMRNTLSTYFPSILGGYLIFTSFFNILSFNKFTKAKLGKLLIGPKFQEWQMPEILVWAFIIFGFMALINQSPYESIGKNGIVIVCIFYLIQGFSILKFFFITFETPFFARLLVYLLLGIQWYGLLFLVFLGLMDNWFHIRTKILKMKNK